MLGLGSEDCGNDFSLQRFLADVAQGKCTSHGEGRDEPRAGIRALKRKDVAPDYVVGVAAGQAVEEGRAERVGDTHAVFGLRTQGGDVRHTLGSTDECAPIAAGQADLRQQGHGAFGVDTAEAGATTGPIGAGGLHGRVGEEGERGGRGMRGGVVGVGEVEGLGGVDVAVFVGVSVRVVVGAAEVGLGPGEALGGEGDVLCDGAVGLAGAVARSVLGQPDAGDDTALAGFGVGRG